MWCKEVTVENMFDYKQNSGTANKNCYTDTCMSAEGNVLTSDRVKLIIK